MLSSNPSFYNSGVMKSIIHKNSTDDTGLVRLRKGLLAAGGYRLYDVAEDLESSIGHVSEILNSRKLPTKSEALKIANLLGGGVDVLFPHTKKERGERP